MSATFWNMRRRAAAQKPVENIVETVENNKTVENTVETVEKQPTEKPKKGKVKKDGN